MPSQLPPPKRGKKPKKVQTAPPGGNQTPGAKAKIKLEGFSELDRKTRIAEKQGDPKVIHPRTLKGNRHKQAKEHTTAGRQKGNKTKPFLPV